MKLALNTTPLLSPLTGIGQYILHLAQELAKDPDLDIEYFYGVAWSKQLKAFSSQQAGKAFSFARNYLPFSYELRRLVQTQRFRFYAKKQKFDVYHEPNYLLMPFQGPTVLTVHDLSWITYPETHPKERVKAMNKHIESSLRCSQRIITDSEFIRQEIIDTFAIQPEKIHAIPLGVSHDFQPKTVEESAAILTQYDLRHGSYFLAVGTLEPRKNLKLVFAAYRKLPVSIRKHYPLVLAGIKGWQTQEIDHELGSLVKNNEVRLLGYISRTDLATITAGALTLVYPSIYEGFGLPPLEAMACGVPPIVSNVSSLPEVVTQGGLSVDPHDIDGLTQAMQCLTEHIQLREKLQSEALTRAKQLTWQNCAQKTLAVYQQAICDY